LVKGVAVTYRFTQKALVEALKYARPKDDEAWKALELADTPLQRMQGVLGSTSWLALLPSRRGQ
jgi:hypothetical protein